MSETTVEVHTARHIAERTWRFLVQRNLVEQADHPPTRPLFYVLPRRERAVLAFDPLALKSVDRLLSPRTLHHLSTALGGRRVVAMNSRGVFLQIAYWPTPSAPPASHPLDLRQQPFPLHVPIGMTKRGPLWLSLPEMDSVLIGGSRRMGKTHLLHGWIQALLHGGEATLILWDGKGGVEFGRYAGRSGVVVDPSDGREGMERAFAEMSRRADLFRQAGVPSLAEYVRRTGDRLPPLALILDEVAFLPEEAQAVLTDLVAKGGAFGVYPVLATQRPDAQAVKALVRVNLSTRIAFPVPSVHDSMVVLGRPGAEKLPKRKGRLLLVWEGRLVEAQAFRVSLPDAGAVRPEAATLLTDRERRLVEAAVRLGGWFRIRQLAEVTGESRDWVNKVARRWEAMGYLTPVQVNERGHRLGRRVTGALLRAAGLGGQADLADEAD
ncbi:MAG TPA: hypothetical protein G4O00_14390 [Thermoflexia bacterium]|nr:hypothetical protein [Thermoflexia bacterium]